MRQQFCKTQAFTLIELSIVLVIIGLIVGGVLVGRDLIKASEVRATITQVDKYNQAVNVFYGKYGGLPGDLPAPYANQFGFTPRGAYAGEGDGNGLLQGVSGNGPGINWGWVDAAGETVMFWVDLTTANGLNINLIEGGFSAASPTFPATPIMATGLNSFFPQAKLGGGNYFYVYSPSSSTQPGNSINYFGLAAVTGVNNNGGCNGCLNSNPGLTVKQAYDIDSKIDDGLPTSGRVIAQGVNEFVVPASNAASASSTTCYDTTTNTYSITQNGGANMNCVLGFQMQGGD